MRRAWRRLGWAHRAAGLALGAALGVAGAAGAGAWHVSVEGPARAAPSSVPLPTLPAREAALPRAQVLAAIGKAPFRPDRQPPARRYLLPDERRAAAVLTPAAPYRQMKLLGTAVLPDGGGLAALQLSGQSAQVVRVGDPVGAFTLIAVAPGVATLAGPDTTIVLRLPLPGRQGGTR